MKKIIVLIGFLLLINACFAIETAIDVKGRVQGQQQAIRSKYFNKMVPQTQPVPAPQPAPSAPSQGQRPNKPHYIPRTYAFEYVTPKKEEVKEQIIINNTYNYYNSTDTSKPETKEKTKTPAQIQKEKDDAERKALRAKYSHILSNTTMENSKMCSLMAQEFPNASKDELNRVLNKILRLNCNISKLK